MPQPVMLKKKSYDQPRQHVENQTLQEMARVNIDILGISELIWTRMGKFNQMTIISTTVDKNHLEEME